MIRWLRMWLWRRRFERCAIFSGNVNVTQTTYPPEQTALTVLQDAADSEFPHVANY